MADRTWTFEEAVAAGGKVGAHHVAFALAIAIEVLDRSGDPAISDALKIMQQDFPRWCAIASGSTAKSELTYANMNILRKDASQLIDNLMQRTKTS